MNNNKKIIKTLRSADKASVEKLMAEEVKKNEIFEKIQQRANTVKSENSEYTNNVSGVEKYERRISMIRIASIAASAILITGSVFGGTALIMNYKKPVDTAADPSQSSAVITTETATEENTTSVTETTTTAVTEPSTEGTQQYSVIKDELIAKADKCEYYFDKFSADYTVFINERREFHTEPETWVGKVYLNETDLTASATVERYENDKCISKSLIAIMDNSYYNAEESWAETDYSNGGYVFLATPDRYFYVDDQNTDRVFISPWGRAVELDVYAPENWDITGERTENGRKIISISGVQKGDNNYEGVYRELPYTLEVDAETGMTLSYDLYDSDGNKTYSYELTNYKFDDEAVEFRTAADIISEIENGGYSMR